MATNSQHPVPAGGTGGTGGKDPRVAGDAASMDSMEAGYKGAPLIFQVNSCLYYLRRYSCILKLVATLLHARCT